MNIKKLNIDNIVTFIMKENNVPNIQLQKYYQLKWFFFALKNNVFTFQKPSSWDDPFEDFLSKLCHNNYSFDVTKEIFAMSTINKRNECAGMWKNYAKNNGVLIYTSSKKIIKSMVIFLINNNCFKNKELFMNENDIKNQLIGSIKLKKIKYRSNTKIANFFISTTSHNNIDFDKLSFDALSIKKTEYNYESEYRVFFRPQFLMKEGKYLNIGCFKETINKIILSPHAKTTRTNRLISLLTKKYGIERKLIDQSTLYNINDFKRKYGFS